MPYLSTNGARLYYSDQGTGEPVILLHGLGSSSRDWEHQVPVLAGKYRVICLDMRGHGQSEKPKAGYSIKGFADDCMALITELGLHKPHLVGISMGGMIAFQLATDHPDTAASLTIVNSAPEVKPRRPREYLMAGKRLLLAHALPLSVTATALAKMLFPKPEQLDLRETFSQRWRENDRGPYLASLRAIIGWGVMEHIDRICCPVLVISADEDYTPVEHKREYVARLGDARLEVVADSRHATPVDQVLNFNKLMLDFLQECGSSNDPRQETNGA